MPAEIDGPSKGLLGAIAVLTLGSGIASLVYGICLLINNMAIEHNYGVFNLFMTSIVLIVVGGLLILTIILGIIGAVKDISKLRLVTLVLLFLLFVVLAVVGVWAMVSFKTGQLQKSIESDIKNINHKSNDLPQQFKDKADYLNRHYNCCGTFGSDDEAANYQGQYPDSCCIVPGCGEISGNNPSKYFQKSCGRVYFDFKSKIVFYLAILTLAAAGAVLIALILYAVVSQRARTEYAAVSGGQLK